MAVLPRRAAAALARPSAPLFKGMRVRALRVEKMEDDALAKRAGALDATVRAIAARALVNVNLDQRGGGVAPDGAASTEAAHGAAGDVHEPFGLRRGRPAEAQRDNIPDMHLRGHTQQEIAGRVRTERVTVTREIAEVVQSDSFAGSDILDGFQMSSHERILSLLAREG